MTSKSLISEKQLHQLTRDLAISKRKIVMAANLTQANQIAAHFDLTLVKGPLPPTKDGLYDEAQGRIILNARITSEERRKFTFYHELMHYFIRQDDDLLSLIHDNCAPNKLDDFLERLCQLGAGEFVIPSDVIRNHLTDNPFSISAIPFLCERFNASAPAVAFQMTYCAPHECYLVVCEPDFISYNADQMTFLKNNEDDREMLRIVYSARSQGARYSVAPHTIIPREHLLYAVYRDRTHIRGMEDIPFKSGRKWIVECDATYFRRGVYSFFNVTAPAAPQQLSLF